MARYDAIVVGASVAGSATAALLGQAGYRILLADKATFPRAKVCGEGLMPAGRRLLEQLGVASQIRRLGATSFSSLHFHLPSGRLLPLDLCEGRSDSGGWVLCRESLDTVLARFAASQPGVELKEGWRVKEARWTGTDVEVDVKRGSDLQTHRSALLIAADGIRSRFREKHGIQRISRPRQRFALRRLYSDFPSDPSSVDVYCSSHAEAYVACLGETRARITLLLDKKQVEMSKRGRQLEAHFDTQLARFETLSQRLAGSRPAGPVEATSPVSSRFSHSHGERLLLVGDAAGAVDPITGQGMTVALRDAFLAARIVKSLLPHGRLSSADLAVYSRLREPYFLASYTLASQLLSALRFPWVADRARLALSRSRSLRRRVTSMAVDPSPETSLTSLERLRLVAGF